jgi:hypothetical protein
MLLATDSPKIEFPQQVAAAESDISVALATVYAFLMELIN